MNQEILRYVLVLVLLPLWIPFLKALWGELLRAMRPEGGLFGPLPRKDQREQIEREMEGEESPVVDEPLAHRRAAAARGGGRALGSARRSAGGAPKPSVRKRHGFR
jgi:hypothetical protein